MKRLATLVGLALLCLGQIGPANATQAPAGPPPLDFAQGTGLATHPVDPTLTYTFDFSAESDPTGGSPSGSFTFVFASGTVTGTVNCLRLGPDPGWADIGGVVTGATGGNAGLLGNQVSFTVRDGGLAGDGISSLGGPLGPADPLCFRQSPNFSVVGEIVVFDAVCDKFKDKPGADKDKCKTKK
jgi:hypothetical protein